MCPGFTNRFRVATVVRGSEDEVRAHLADLPSTIRVRTTATTAGVVVTLEQERSGPLVRRRRTIRSLLRQLDLVSGAITRVADETAEVPGLRRQLTPWSEPDSSSTAR